MTKRVHSALGYLTPAEPVLPALARPVPWPTSARTGPNPTGSSSQDPEGRDGRPGFEALQVARPFVRPAKPG